MNATLSVQDLWSQILALPAGPYTMEEINAWIDESEADEEAGRTYTCAEVKQMMETKYPWLCK